MKIKHAFSCSLVLIVALAAVSLRSWRNQVEAMTTARAEDLPTVPPWMTTSQPVLRTFAHRVPWIGVVQSQASIQLIATRSGRVASVEIQDGMSVETGASLMRLGGVRIESECTRLQNRVESLKSQHDLASQAVERLRENWKTQIATKDQLAAAQQSEVDLQAQLRNAELALDSFQTQLRITAPMAGVYTRRRVSPGQRVNVGDVLAEIIDPHSLRIVASLFPPEGAALDGKETTIHLEKDDTLSGSVRRVLPQAGRTGATLVWIEGPRIDQRLRPGQSVSGSLVIEMRSSALSVPDSAIVYDADEQPYLFVPRGGAYDRRSVRLGMVEDGWVEILSGIEEDQSVVTQGAHELFYRNFNEQFKVVD